MLEIKSLSQFNQLKKNPLLIIDFYAVWCGPCKVISPGFHRHADKHKDLTSIVFAQVDVDKAKDVAQECGITAMTTFQFFKDGKKVDEVRGADVQQLNTKVAYYTSQAPKGSAGPSSKPAASSSGSSSGASSAPGSLRPLIDLEGSRLLNASLLSSVKNITSPPPAGAALSSATGQQKFLVHLKFTQAVTPRQLKIKIVKNSLSNAPSRINVGSNVPVHITKSPEGVETNDLTLDSLSKAENSQSFNVFSDEYRNDVAELTLKASKFTGITSLTIAVDANLSGDAKTITKVGELDIIGSRA